MLKETDRWQDVAVDIAWTEQFAGDFDLTKPRIEMQTMWDLWKDAAAVGYFSFVLVEADSDADLVVEVRSTQFAVIELNPQTISEIVFEPSVLGIAEPDELHLRDPMPLSTVVKQVGLELREKMVVATRIQVQY